jgi:hypothetical protein
MTEGAMMGRYFQSLEQAEKHVDKQKHHTYYGKLQWCIIDCTIGYLVISEAQAKHCFPALFHGSQQSLTKPMKAPERYDIDRV